MALKEFINVGDARITVEKEVKPKLTIAELTTIEQPGRPVPASQLENEGEKRKGVGRGGARKEGARKEPSRISSPKREYTLILTEKPQAAQKIAFALGNPQKRIEGRVSYFELEKGGKKILVASAVGHLFNLSYVKGQRGYPMFKLEWNPSYETKAMSYTKAYYDLLKKLGRKSNEFIIATDYDIEGEVIGWNIVRFIFGQKSAKRMKYSTLTKPELEKSYDNLMAEPDWGMAYAGETRHILDWLYGINLSRALMSAIKTSGSFKILSIGRVQGPALKIIVDRELEIENFKPEPFWQVLAYSNGIEFKHPKDIFDKKLLEKFKSIKEAIAETKKTEEHIQPPVPFDLTTLQREAYRWHGISPSGTLQAAQKLYLDGLISYPRTSSQQIPDSVEPKKILKLLEKNFPQAKLATRAKPIEGKKSDPAHPSIFPTGEFKVLTENELKLYNLIVKRFISVFAPDAVTANKRIVLTTEVLDEEGKPVIFNANGLNVLEKGWTQIYPHKFEEFELPDLNGKVKIDEIKFEDKETQPPKRFTPASLITILEKKGLGTKTTRSIIIDILFNRGYLEGNSIKATALGIQLIRTLEKHSSIIIDENLTRKMEDEMDAIQFSKEKNLLDKEKEVISKAEKIITDISKEFKVKEMVIGKELLEGLQTHRRVEQENNTIIKCPTCKEGMLRIIYSNKTKRSFIGCSAYPNCKQTYTLPPNSLIKKSEKTCVECGFPMLMSIRKGKRPWEFCFNSNCPTVKKRIEEWQKKKDAAVEKAS